MTEMAKIREMVDMSELAVIEEMVIVAELQELSYLFFLKA
jgi:hypothetical protein